MSARVRRCIAVLAGPTLLSACNLLMSLDGLSESSSANGGASNGGAPTGQGGAGPTTTGSHTGSGGSGSVSSGGSGGGRSYPQEVLADKPVAYWRLGEQSGTVAHDETANGHDGEYVGDPMLGFPGAIGDGDTAIAVPPGRLKLGEAFDFAGAEPFTYEFWMRATGPNSNSCLLNKLQVESAPSGGLLFTGQLVFAHERSIEVQHLVDNFVVLSAHGQPLETRALQHTAITYDGTNVRIYQAGSLVNAMTVRAQNPEAGATLQFGRCPQGSWNPLKAIIDEIAVYDYALSPERIAVHASFGH